MGIYDNAKALSGSGSSATGGGSLYERANAVASGNVPQVSIPEPETLEDTQDKVLETIRAKRARGEDTTRLEQSLRKTIAPTPDTEAKSFGQQAVELPGAAAKTFFPAISKFLTTTGGVLGEGAAAVLPGGESVRSQLIGEDEMQRAELQDKILDQIREGKAEGRDVSRLEATLRESIGDTPNPLRALETIDETTPAEYVKYGVAAGIEYAVYRSFPDIAKLKLGKRAGAGAIQGVGFAIAEGLANDRSPEEIVDSLAAYGVGGAAISIITPYLIPLLKGEFSRAPGQLKEMFKGINQAPKRINVTSAGGEGVRVPISTPNTRYEAYLRSQGYEPYIPTDELPVIDYGRSRRASEPVIQLDSNKKAPTPAGTKLVPEEQVQKATKENEIIQAEDIVPEERTTTVPREQLPVESQGETGVSRLEARVKGVLEDPKTAQRAEEEGIETYSIMNKQDQIRQAIKYVENNPDDALRVLRGEKSAPKGLLNNSIALALEKFAASEADANLAIKLASLRSTRAGQEISILTEAEPANPVSFIDEIIKARARKVERGLKSGETVTTKVSTETKAATKALEKEQLKLEEAYNVLDGILC